MSSKTPQPRNTAVAAVQPTLSLCLAGRDDDYSRDFRRRFVQAMDFLAYSARRAGVLDRLEVVFTDWNCERPFAQHPLFSPDAARMVRFVEVPPEHARNLNFEDTPFHTTRSVNVAFRRARGAFIGMMPADVLIRSRSLAALFDILEGRETTTFDPHRAVLGVPRKLLPAFRSEEGFFDGPDQVDALLCDADFFLKQSTFGHGLLGNYGAFILDRDLLFDCRGLNESMGGWAFSDVEIALRIGSRASVVNLSGSGVVCYDFDADLRMTRQKTGRLNSIEGGHREAPINEDNWGCAGVPFRETAAPPRTGPTPAPIWRPDHPNLATTLQDAVLTFGRPVPPHFGVEAVVTADLFRRLTVRRALLLGSVPNDGVWALSLVSPYTAVVFVNTRRSNHLHHETHCSVLGLTRHVGNVVFLVSPVEALSGEAFRLAYAPVTTFDFVRLAVTSEASERDQASRLRDLATPDAVLLVKHSPRWTLTHLLAAFPGHRRRVAPGGAFTALLPSALDDRVPPGVEAEWVAQHTSGTDSGVCALAMWKMLGARRARIAVYGAGMHSYWLQRATTGADFELPKVVALVDPDGDGRRCFDLDPIGPAHFDPAMVDYIFISTDVPEDVERMRRDCVARYGCATAILLPYRDVPDVVENRAVEVWRRLGLEGTRVAVFGAGSHTVALERAASGGPQPEVVAVLDRTAASATRCFGLRPTLPETFDPRLADAVFVSSNRARIQAEMSALAQILWPNLRVVMPHADELSVRRRAFADRA